MQASRTRDRDRVNLSIDAGDCTLHEAKLKSVYSQYYTSARCFVF